MRLPKRLVGAAITTPARTAALVLAIAATVTAVTGAAAPASAATRSSSAAGPGAGWVRAPQPAFDAAAGVDCDAPIHAQPLVDEVYGKTLAGYPDGTPKRVVYAGPLTVRVTNTDTGAYDDVNASGTAVVDFGTDGSQVWNVVGPVLIGAKANSGNIPRGMWVVDGVYRIAFSATGTKTLTMWHGSMDNVCTHIQ